MTTVHLIEARTKRAAIEQALQARGGRVVSAKGVKHTRGVWEIVTTTDKEERLVLTDDMAAPIAEEDDEELAPDAMDAQSRLHVKREQCSTCIFKPGNKMQLRAGRMADLTAETDARDANVVCHQTLDGIGALCRGSVDRRPGQMYRIAERLNGLVLDD
jgi:hypothetical protein